MCTLSLGDHELTLQEQTDMIHELEYHGYAVTISKDPVCSKMYNLCATYPNELNKSFESSGLSLFELNDGIFWWADNGLENNPPLPEADANFIKNVFYAIDKKLVGPALHKQNTKQAASS